METEFIPIDLLCNQHGIEISFLRSLREYGLVEITTVNEAECIEINSLSQAEKMVRLHGDLGVNLEGIDVITHLLQRITGMQHELMQLRNRLSFYERDDR
ncbi:MAG: hypothetical protein JWQ78_1092 [Sediminibacterium sp.]|nr:hypothetical protein [Sediminibacterium sp.]